MRKCWKMLVVLLLSLMALGLHEGIAAGGLSSEIPPVATMVLLKKGVMVGDPSGDMRWNEHITRAEAVKVLVATMGLGPAKSIALGQAFADVGADHWSQGWVAQAVAVGIVRGYADRTFRPDRPLAMAEYAVMLSRVYVSLGGRLSEAVTVDIEPRWASSEIGRAEPVRRWLGLGRGSSVDLGFPINRAQAGSLAFTALQEFGLAYDMVGRSVRVDADEGWLEIEVSSHVIRLDMGADSRVMVRETLAALPEIPLGAVSRIVLGSPGVCSLVVVE